MLTWIVSVSKSVPVKETTFVPAVTPAPVTIPPMITEPVAIVEFIVTVFSVKDVVVKVLMFKLKLLFSDISKL